MNDYPEHEKQIKAIEKEHEKILRDFKTWLTEKGLSSTTIEKHCFNINFFINAFLLHYETKKASEGTDAVSMFLGFWFIRKAMWSSESRIRSNVASLKKFYQFVVERGEVSPDKYAQMRMVIKEELPTWIETVN